MNALNVSQLDAGCFQKYGVFSDFVHVDSFSIGSPPCEFFRDLAVLDLGSHTSASFSICRIGNRPTVIDCLEYHNCTGEGMMPLDGDVYLCFAPASLANEIPLENVEVFFVPRHTMITIRPGVWHCAAYTVGSDSVDVLIILPERTYTNDCVVVPLIDGNQIEFANT